MSDAQRVTLVGAAVGLAIFGSLAHNAMEFGATSVLASRNGELLFVLVWLAVFALWWRVPGARRPAMWAIVALALLNLIGGAIITVIPFGFLPFEPEQSFTHYLAHVIYGLAQIPIILFGLREARLARASTSGAAQARPTL
jgi:hypothetical protein